MVLDEFVSCSLIKLKRAFDLVKEGGMVILVQLLLLD